VNRESMNWTEILDLLSAVPADDPCWSTFDDFIKQVRHIGDLKKSELEEMAAFSRLEHELLQDYGDLIAFLSTDAEEKFRDVLANRPSELLGELNKFRDSLQQYRGNRSITKFRSIIEEREHRNRLTDQENSLCEQIERLLGRNPVPHSTHLSPSAPPLSDSPAWDSPSSDPPPSDSSPSDSSPSDSSPSDSSPSDSSPSDSSPSDPLPSDPLPSDPLPSDPPPSDSPPSDPLPSDPPSSETTLSNPQTLASPEPSNPSQVAESIPRERLPSSPASRKEDAPATPGTSTLADSLKTRKKLRKKQRKERNRNLAQSRRGNTNESSTDKCSPLDRKLVEELLREAIDSPPDSKAGQVEKNTFDSTKTGDDSRERIDNATSSGPANNAGQDGDKLDDVVTGDNASEGNQQSINSNLAESKANASPTQLDESTCLSKAIQERDFASAYWWCRSKEAAGDVPPIPSMACALAQGVLWNPRLDLAVADDIQRLATNINEVPSLAGSLLTSGSAIRVALSVPSLQVNHLLTCSADLPSYHALLNEVKRFSERGLKIEPSVVGEQLSSEKLDDAINDAAVAAIRWIDDASNRRFNFEPATRVWRTFLRDEEFLRGFFTTISENKQRDHSNMRPKMEAWRQRSSIIGKIAEADEKTNRKFSTNIDAGAQEKLVSGCFEAIELCSAWCDAIAYKEQANSPQDWLGQQVAELRQVLKKLLPEAKAELEAQMNGLGLLHGASAYALESCEHVRALVAPDEPPLATLSDTNQSDYLLGLEPRGLWPGLRRRLWCLPGLRFLDSGEPFADDLPLVADALDRSSSEETSLEAIFRQRIEDRDFRHTEEMLSLMSEQDTASDLQNLLVDGIKRASDDLLHKLESLDRQLQDAILNGSLTELERIEIENALKCIRDSNPRNFRVPFEQLISLENRLEEVRSEQIEHLQVSWQSNREVLLSRLEDDARKEVETRVQTALASGEPRVAIELLTQLQVSASRHEVPYLKPAGIDPTPLAEFETEQARMVETAERWDIDAIKLSDQADLAALNAWRQLRNLDISNDDSRLISIFALLGLTPSKSNKCIEVRDRKRAEWVHVTSHLSDSGNSPIPQFGSVRENRYDFLLVSSRKSGSPGNTITTALKNASLKRQPTIVLFQGAMTEEHRVAMSRKIRSSGMPAIVLDESLLFWIVQKEDNRWATFLRVALAFSFVSPYAPTGSVPREMFFGRRQMLDRILDFEGSGSSIVYGGRQLGKTALLHRAQREFHVPERNQFAIYESIQNLGDPMSDVPASEIGRVLGERLKETILSDSDLRTRDIAKVSTALRRHMDQHSDLRLLILLDEADDFLAQDAKQGFRLVIELKKLMEQTNRHVKVVFAGLNSVQYQRYPNQPFAHLGNPIEVGPLEPASAYELISQPMSDIGFRFENDAAILKVLSYTNHHPGLIQYFCDELVKGTQNGIASEWPPRVISNKSVRDLYARSSTKQEIAKRFSWTLDLNPLFNAIICKVVLDQYERRSTETISFRADDLLEHMRGWWPAAFKPMAVEELRTLLTDMCGLGIFYHAEAGYQLRNPNLADAVGTYDEVLSRLDSLQDLPAPRSGIDAEHHRQLVSKTKRRSPFTLTQVSSLLTPRFGVGLIFGSAALGADDIEPAIREILNHKTTPENTAEVQAITIDPSTASEWKRRLEDLHSKAGRNPKAVFLIDVLDPSQIPIVVRQSLEFCQPRRKAEQSWVRILIRMLPDAVAAWHAEEPDTRLALEQSVDCVIEMTLWHPSIVETHLTKGERLGGAQVFDSVNEATGRWPLLLEEVYQRCGEGHDPSPHAKAIAAELTEDGDLAHRFAVQSGITENVIPVPIRKILCEYAAEPCDPEFLDLAMSEAPGSEKSYDGLARTLLRLQILLRSQDGVVLNPQALKVMR